MIPQFGKHKGRAAGGALGGGPPHRRRHPGDAGDAGVGDGLGVPE